ncbi:MAG TPA: DNA-processing protein DprA, partial [Solirubrobacterales bacterium]|nr:DNA-processing protein DprA [Solirubrobacterales bacterium]
SLWRRIGEAGLVLSELPPGAPPWRWTFPARNRIMAALAGMTVVVEAAARSGSLITTDLAAGAHVIRDAQDVLDAMLGPGRRQLDRSGPTLDPQLEAVLAAVEAGESTCDAVATSTGVSGPAAAAALARLELLGYLTCSATGTYRRTLLSGEA